MTLNARSEKPRSALREFLAVENLLRALVLSGIVTALAIPRIIVAGYEGTFLGTDVLVTNLTYFSNDAAHDQVLRVVVGERGVSALRPAVVR